MTDIIKKFDFGLTKYCCSLTINEIVKYMLKNKEYNQESIQEAMRLHLFSLAVDVEENLPFIIHTAFLKAGITSDEETSQAMNELQKIFEGNREKIKFYVFDLLPKYMEKMTGEGFELMEKAAKDIVDNKKYKEFMGEIVIDI